MAITLSRRYGEGPVMRLRRAPPILLLLALASPTHANTPASSGAPATGPASPVASERSAATSAAAPASATATAFGDARDSPAWSALAGIAGTWAIATPTSDAQRAFRVSYRLLPNAAALVETYGDPDGRFTQTIFHPDGHRIVATHYCAQGNQPRLQLSGDSDTLDFLFFDATNLPDPNASHLTRLQLVHGDNTLSRRETYTSAGVEAADVLELRRID